METGQKEVDPAPLIEQLFNRLEWRGDCLVVLISGEHRPHAYGTVWRHSRVYKASRFVYASVHGWEAIRGLLVRHTCDNPPCVNVDHLVPGSAADNARDMVERRRHRSQRKADSLT